MRVPPIVPILAFSLGTWALIIWAIRGAVRVLGG